MALTGSTWPLLPPASDLMPLRTSVTSMPLIAFSFVPIACSGPRMSSVLAISWISG